jgi:HK97 family phage portal protein
MRAMRWWWPWRREREERSSADLISVSDPRLAELFVGAWAPNYSGVEINETSALSLSAVFRAVSLISGTVASLPMPTFRERAGVRGQVASFLDDPGGGLASTPFEWKETVLLHLCLHGNAYLRVHRDGFGSILALEPVHPLCVATRWRRPDEFDVIGPKVFTAMLADGSRHDFDTTSMIHIPYMSLDGLTGVSPITYARNSLGTAVAGDRAAAKMFSSGALLSGVLTPADGEDVDEDEAKVIKAEVTRNAAGWENASDIAVINRRMQFTPWTMSAEDLQFLGSRQFQIEEISRWFGVPPHLLMQTEKQTSWGQGVESQNRAMGRTVLLPWTQRIEQRLSRLLPDKRWVQFDFAELERPTPEAEVGLLISQVNAGLLTLNEARHARNLPPVPGGDVVRIGGQPLTVAAVEPAPAPAAPAALPAASVNQSGAEVLAR